MLSSRVLGLLNEIVTEEKKKDLFRKDLLEIHIGLIHGDLLTEFEQARNFVFGMKYLCDLGGIRFFINFNIKELKVVPIYKTMSYEEQLPKEVIEIGGMRPTKSWLKKYQIK